MTTELPADIAAAIEAFEGAVESCAQVMFGDVSPPLVAEIERTRAALDTAILARLTAAEARFKECFDGLDAVCVQRAKADGRACAALARAERLEGFIDFVLKWRDRGPPHGDPVTAWNVVSHHPVVSERARTRAALSPAAEEA